MEFQSAEDLFHYYKSRYKELSQAVKKNTSREVWSTQILPEVEPFESFRKGYPRGKLLAKAPKKIDGKYLQIFNVNGELICRKMGTDIETGFNEDFFLYSDNTIYSIYYDESDPKEILNAKIRKWQNGRVVTTETCGIAGHRFESFVYKEAFLDHIDVTEFAKGTPDNHYVVEIQNPDDESKIQITLKFPNGYTEQRYPD